MKQYWSEGELVEFWTLSDVERQLSDQRTQQGRLGLAVLLKFFQHRKIWGQVLQYHFSFSPRLTSFTVTLPNARTSPVPEGAVGPLGTGWVTRERTAPLPRRA